MTVSPRYPQASPGNWADRAACTEHPELSWYPPPLPQATLKARVQAAKDVCAGCPVQQECLQHAVDVDELFGIWGGLDEHERGHTRRRLSAPKCAVEGCAIVVQAKGFCNAHYVRWWRTGAPLPCAVRGVGVWP